MSANLASLYGQQYATNVQLLLQQKMSKFRGAVTEGSYTGKQASPVDQVGAVAMQPVTSRFSPKTRTDAAVDRRWVTPSDFDLQQMVDTFDKLKVISDPKGVYTQNSVQAANRQFDDLVIAAFTATALTGVESGTSTSILAGNTVSVSVGGTASNLNVAKLKKGYELMLTNEVDVDSDPIYCAITAKQNTALLNEIQIISADFKQEQKPAVMNGRVMSFLGINFIHSQRLATGTDDASGTSRSIPLWAKSGMHLGLWSDVQSKIRMAEELKGNPWEVYLYMSAGATRLEEKKIVRIWASEA